MYSKNILANRFLRSRTTNLLFQTPLRRFGAMDLVNQDLFGHKFTDDLDFRSSFDKIKCFRVLDEEGNIINKKYENSIDDLTL